MAVRERRYRLPFVLRLRTASNRKRLSPFVLLRGFSRAPPPKLETAHLPRTRYFKVVVSIEAGTIKAMPGAPHYSAAAHNDPGGRNIETRPL